EYERVRQKLWGIVSSSNKEYIFHEWNCVDGLAIRNLNNKKLKFINELEDPEELLKHIITEIDNGKNEIFLIEDFHEFIGERNIKVRLRQLAEKLRFYRKHLILVSSAFYLPQELEKYITVIEMPLPRRIDLEKVLMDVAKNAEVNIDDSLKKKLVD